MEQDIKNFDRTIERIVHEQEIAPPYGVWNRISAELDALPTAETAPVRTLFPKRALTGFIAGALTLAVAVGTAYIMNNVFTNNKITAAITQPAKVISTAPAAEPLAKTDIPNHKNTQPIVETKHKHLNTFAKAKNSASAVAPVAVSMEPVININTLAPCTIKSVNSIADNTTAQAYFFPPIDRNNSDKDMEKISYNKKIGDDDGDDDKKIKSSEQKVKPPHRKRHSFNYGRLNRL